MTVTRKLLPTLDRFEPTKFDSTAVKEFKTCPRKYFYRMVLGRAAPAGKWESVFAWGTAIHKVMEVLYREGDIKKAMEVAYATFRSPLPGKFDFLTKELLTLNIAHLAKFYQSEKSGGMIKCEAVEQPWNLVFPDGVTIGGRFDQIITWNGRIWLRDWKTTSKNFDYFAPSLDPNDQGIRYVYAASCLQFGQTPEGYPKRLIEGVVFQVIQNMKSFTSGPKLQAMPKQWSMNRIIKWVEEQKWWHKRIADCREEDIYPMNEASCTYCDYRSVCTQPDEASMTQQLRYNFLLKPWDFEKVDQEEKTDHV